MSLPARAILPDAPDRLPPSQGEACPSDTVPADPVQDYELGFLNEGGILAAMAKVVMDSIGADGLCVAYAKQGSVVCRASCGDIAPAVGTPLNVNSGIGAQCLREGKTITCTDTETDPRVNKEVCRRIGVRSILAVPLRLNSRVIGIAQAFHAEPSGFSALNILELEQSANLFVSILPVDTSLDEGLKESGQIFQVSSRPVSEPGKAPLAETSTAGSKVEAKIIEAMPAVVSAATSPPEVPAQGLPGESHQISHAAQSQPLPVADSLSMPQAPQRAAGEDVAEGISSFPEASPPESAAESAFTSFVQIEEPVWWKRPTLAAAALSTVLALLWIVTHTTSHPLVPFKHAGTSSALEKPEVETTSLPFAQLQNKARAGDTNAQFALAKRYETGNGVGRNLTKAYSWYIVAAEAGNDSARQAIRPLTSKLSTAQIAAVRFEVARMYANGTGVRARDPVAAYAWMVLAEAAGDRRAKAEQNVLAGSMRPQQIAEAQTRASYWLKSRGYGTQ